MPSAKVNSIVRWTLSISACSTRPSGHHDFKAATMAGTAGAASGPKSLRLAADWHSLRSGWLSLSARVGTIHWWSPFAHRSANFAHSAASESFIAAAVIGAAFSPTSSSSKAAPLRDSATHSSVVIESSGRGGPTDTHSKLVSNSLYPSHTARAANAPTRPTRQQPARRPDNAQHQSHPCHHRTQD